MPNTFQVTPYQMCVRNIARAIRSRPDYGREPAFFLDAFTCSEVLAVAFCKSKEEVCSDLINVELK